MNCTNFCANAAMDILACYRAILGLPIRDNLRLGEHLQSVGLGLGLGFGSRDLKS